MDAELVPFVLLAALCVVVLGLTLAGNYLVKRDTLRKGRWGINTEPMACRQCGTLAPGFRLPKNRSQFLWGGWTCVECGYELDKWGKPVTRQPFPAKWSAKIDDTTAPKDDRIKGTATDTKRKGDSRE